MSMKRSRRALAMIGSLAGCMVLAAALPVVAASDSANENIPQLGSANFGWQDNVGEWADPPKDIGHGPIHPDPAHPYLSNVDAARLGKEATLRIGDAKDPVLKPWAAKVIADSNEETLSGKLDVPFSAASRCYPGGVPGQLLYGFAPMYFIQTKNEVWILWQRDHWFRRIFLNRAHSKNPKPSWFGESVGHYENGALVIDTIGLSTHLSFIDNFRTPHSEKLHVVERYTIEPDGKFLQANVTVDDPDTFNAPLHLYMR
jgi:hypothetical protein